MDLFQLGDAEGGKFVVDDVIGRSDGTGVPRGVVSGGNGHGKTRRTRTRSAPLASRQYAFPRHVETNC